LLALALLVTALVYWPGLHGGWLFDDYPNIVDNKGVQPDEASVSALINAAFSSPSSEFKRPMASLSFAANFMLGGLDPFWMKLTNLLIHLINGVLVFVLVRGLLLCTVPLPGATNSSRAASSACPTRSSTGDSRPPNLPIVAVFIAMAWMLLPINLTAVLYVVQRMESLANIFVLLGLIGYVHGRRLMLQTVDTRRLSPGFLLCLTSLTLPTVIGALAKETAVMLPLYGALVEWYLFDFRSPATGSSSDPDNRRDYRLVAMFAAILVLPLAIGLSYLLPNLLQANAWSTRDFSMTTRLLSEARVVVDYVRWTIVPTSQDLSFYHDDFEVSSGLLTPWTTLASVAGLAVLSAAAIWLRRRHPLAALGIALFLASHLLTGTILPLELIYEHRNYFASLGLLLAVVPSITPRWLALPTASTAVVGEPAAETAAHFPTWLRRGLSLIPLLLLMAWWTCQTAITAYAWGDPLRLARELATRGPQSPRAQYELGRTYIIYSRYDPHSPFTRLAYVPLEQAASLPKSSILPQQALIFMNSRMHLPLQDKWWDSMIAKLKARKPGVQDESSLIALMHCMHDNQCDLPKTRMHTAFQAAISHPEPSARILAAYGDFAWNDLSDATLGERMMTAATKAAPGEAAYKITLFHMLISEKKFDEARRQLGKLEGLNMGGYLDKELAELRVLLPSSHNSK
jgi:hypothetical protein